MKFKSSRTFLFLKLGLGIAVIIFFLFYFNVDEIFRTIEKIKLYEIAVLFSIYIFDRLFMAYKWGLLIKSFKKDVGFWNLAKAYFYGSFTSQFMPVSISGDLVRFYSVSGNGLSKTYLFSSMAVEKIFGFFSMVVAVILAIILYSSPLSTNESFFNGLFISIILLVIASAVILFVFRAKIISNLLDKYNGRFKEKIVNLIESFNFFSKRKEILTKFFLYSLIEQIFPVVGIFILAHSLGIEISFLQVLFIASLGLLLARLPISPSSIGVQESAFVGLFILVGLKGESGFTLSITMRILDMLYPLPIILIYLSDTMKLLKKTKNKESEFV